jgi:hypothetical protein
MDMGFVLDDEALKRVCRLFDYLCTVLGDADKRFSRDLLAKQMMDELLCGVSVSALSHRLLQGCVLTYRLRKTDDCWEWQVHYRGTVIRNGAGETSIDARAAAMLFAGMFRTH